MQINTKPIISHHLLLDKFFLPLQLETRLAEKEEQLLEKDLIFEQVTRLAGRVRGKAETGKDDTLDLAKRVSG